MQSDKITFKQYLESERLEEDISLSPVILPLIYSAVSLFAVTSKGETPKGMTSILLQLLNHLSAFGVKDEFQELVDDPKLKKALRFGGESGERRAMEILNRHMKGMTPDKKKKFEKAFKAVKRDTSIKLKLDD